MISNKTHKKQLERRMNLEKDSYLVYVATVVIGQLLEYIDDGMLFWWQVWKVFFHCSRASVRTIKSCVGVRAVHFYFVDMKIVC